MALPNCEKISNKLEPDILLNTDTTSAANLSKNISNYKRLKIFYSDMDGFKNCIEIYNNKKSNVFFGMSGFNNNGDLFIKTARGNISGTSLTIDRQYQTVLTTTPGITTSSGTYITINRIEGYK